MTLHWALSGVILLPAFVLTGEQGSQAKSETESAAARSHASDLVVHEWGTFTTVAGSDGAALEWRPLLGKTSDLPSFVHGTARNDGGRGLRFRKAGEQDPGTDAGGKKDMRATVRMETPVLYFYTKQAQRISVRVDFPGGKITEWYPKASWVGSGIDWGQIELQPGYEGSFPREKADNHYYPARRTDAVPVRVHSDTRPVVEHERFLFYRGVGTFPLPLRATLSDGRLLLENRSRQEIPAILLFDRREDGIRISVIDRLAPGKPVRIRPTTKSKETAIHRRLERILEEQGLHGKEAKAMVATWSDHWFMPGLRVFYVLPTQATEAILPLRITPTPKAVVRVLVGRIEILRPEEKARIRGLALELGAPDFETRDRATQALIRIGRFAAPVLEEILLDSKDLEVRARIESLLQR